MRRTKIVCTLGLVSNTRDVISEMMDAGMNVARFNFSHGTHESHKKTLDLVKELRKEKELPIATLLDTKGPEIRLGDFENGKAEIETGESFTLHTEPIKGNNKEASVTFKDLDKDVDVGNIILLDDGLIELKVKSISGGKINCFVVNGGPISDKKGVNVPGVKISMPYISQRDRDDLIFGVEQGYDYIAASFVQNAENINEIRDILMENGGGHIRIIAKIENAEGVENIDEIINAADGIMVARGDMGVEVPIEDLPYLQKKLIKKCRMAGKIVITATQMLESMVSNPRPTRAEVSDVANAVYDGTSAIMLSGETAAGKYPVRAVVTMAKIAVRTESDIDYRKRFVSMNILDAASTSSSSNVTDAISHATCTTAFDINAAAIITVTMSGRTAHNVSKFRPDTPIFACTTSEQAYNQLSMVWGVIPIQIPVQESMDDLFSLAVKEASNIGYIERGDLVVITTGVPLGVAGTTNLIKVHIAGNVLVNGTGINSLEFSGKLCVAKTAEEIKENFNDGDILVVRKTSNELMPVLRRASGIVAEEAGLHSHAAIVGLSLDIPVIVGADNATNILTSGTYVTLDAKRGIVCSEPAYMDKKSKSKKSTDKKDKK